MKEIKKYIAFWIKNWFNKIDDKDYVIENGIITQFDWEYNANIEHCIMKKEFIEAIARGITGIIGTQWFVEYKWEYIMYKEYINILTKEQAIHIREWTLPEFINNLLPKN